MYITDLNQIRHCYKCKKCSKIFKNMEACNRHEKNCDELVKHTFPGGFYNKSKSIFDKIDEQLYGITSKKSDENFEEEAIDEEQEEKKAKSKKFMLQKTYKINDCDKYYPFECAFDFEAMLKTIEVEDNEKKLKIVSEHIPVSVSLFSNVPDFDNKPIFLCNDKPDKLISEFVKTICNISMKALKINERKYKDIIEDLEKNIQIKKMNIINNYLNLKLIKMKNY